MPKHVDMRELVQEANPIAASPQHLTSGRKKKKKTYRIFFGHCRLRKILFTRRHSQHSICLIISFYSGRIVSIASDKIAMWKSSIRNLQACQRRRNNRSTVSRHTIHGLCTQVGTLDGQKRVARSISQHGGRRRPALSTAHAQRALVHVLNETHDRKSFS